MSKFHQNRIKDGWEKLHKQTDKPTDYENNGHLAVNQKSDDQFLRYRPEYVLLQWPSTSNKGSKNSNLPPKLGTQP